MKVTGEDVVLRKIVGYEPHNAGYPMRINEDGIYGLGEPSLRLNLDGGGHLWMRGIPKHIFNTIVQSGYGLPPQNEYSLFFEHPENPFDAAASVFIETGLPDAASECHVHGSLAQGPFSNLYGKRPLDVLYCDAGHFSRPSTAVVKTTDGGHANIGSLISCLTLAAMYNTDIIIDNRRVVYIADADGFCSQGITHLVLNMSGNDELSGTPVVAGFDGHRFGVLRSYDFYRKEFEFDELYITRYLTKGRYTVERYVSRMNWRARKGREIPKVERIEINGFVPGSTSMSADIVHENGKRTRMIPSNAILLGRMLDLEEIYVDDEIVWSPGRE